jgi:hypothetical protein
MLPSLDFDVRRGSRRRGSLAAHFLLAASSKLISTQTSSIFSLCVFKLKETQYPSVRSFGFAFFLGLSSFGFGFSFFFEFVQQQQLLYVGVDVWGQHFQQGFCMRDSYVAEYSDASAAEYLKLSFTCQLGC